MAIETVISTDTVEIVGGPATINLDLEIGASGERGGKFFAGYGNPNDNPPTGALAKDLYINVQSTSEEYSFLYQYINSNWVQILKLHPATYAKIDNATFDNGLANIIIAANQIVNLTENNNLTASNFNIQCNVINSNPTVASVSSIIYALENGILKLTFDLNAVEFVDGEWSNIDTNKPVHILITVV